MGSVREEAGVIHVLLADRIGVEELRQTVEDVIAILKRREEPSLLVVDLRDVETLETPGLLVAVKLILPWVTKAHHMHLVVPSPHVRAAAVSAASIAGMKFTVHDDMSALRFEPASDGGRSDS